MLSWQARRKGWGSSILAEQKRGNGAKKQLPL